MSEPMMGQAHKYPCNDMACPQFMCRGSREALFVGAIPVPAPCPNCAAQSRETGELKAALEEALEALNDSLAASESERDALKGALRLNLESNVANLFVLDIVRAELKKIEGPDWDGIIASIQEEHDRAQDALASPATSAQGAGERPAEDRR